MGIESALGWLAAAGAVVWLGLGGYVALLAARQRAMGIRLKQLEQREDDS